MKVKLGDVLCRLIATTTIASCLVTKNLVQAGQQQECMDELRFCLHYLNNVSQPPDSCCLPLDYVIKSIPECLCSLMSLLGFQQAGVNISKAQTLPHRCGQQNFYPLACITGTPDERAKNSASNSVVSAKLWNSSLIPSVAASSLILILLAL